jgi:hypothetical protein
MVLSVQIVRVKISIVKQNKLEAEMKAQQISIFASIVNTNGEEITKRLYIFLTFNVKKYINDYN